MKTGHIHRLIARFTCVQACVHTHKNTRTQAHIHMTGHKHANMLPQLRKLHSRPAAFPKGGSTVKKKKKK